jgi:hypothetical protein
MLKTLAFFLVGVAILGGLLLLSNSDYLSGKQAQFQKAAQPVAQRVLAALTARDLSSLSAQEQLILRDIAGRMAASNSIPRTSETLAYSYSVSFDPGLRQSMFFMTPLDIEGTATALHLRVDDVGSGPQLARGWIEGQPR